MRHGIREESGRYRSRSRRWSSVRQVCYDHELVLLQENPRPMCIPPAVVTTIVLLAAPPSPLEHLGRFDARALPEASGIAKSRRHPGIFWVHNDSGNPPALFAIRRDGTVVREFRLEVPNVDWEDIAADNEGHLYLGDIGNNGGLLALRAVYRLDEPDPARPATAPLRVSAATFYF